MTGATPHLFPLNPAPSQARPQQWLPFTTDEIKNLRRAVKEDGIGSPYAQQLLEELGAQLVLPYDWISLARAILAPGQFVEWRCHFQAEAERRIAENASAGIQDPQRRTQALVLSPILCSTAMRPPVFGSGLEN